MRALRLALSVLGLAFVLSAEASAATITVNTTSDTNDAVAPCSLREAIETANTNAAAGGCVPQGPFASDPDVIEVPSGLYKLTLDGAETDTGTSNTKRDLDVQDEAIIRNTGRGRAIIDGNGSWRVFDLTAAGDGVTLSGLTIQNGKETFAGGIRSIGKTLIENTTIAGNEATAGNAGGITGTGGGSELTMENVTVSGNRATGGGGGVLIGAGTALLSGVTITGNTADTDGSGGGNHDGGGLHQFLVTVTLRGTLIAGNTDATPGAEAPDCSGSVPPTSGGNNLIGNTTGCGYVAGTGDVLNQPAKLGPLADNGGRTFTRALLAGSPAIDKGSSLAPATDQRGFPRVGQPDIGAYERLVCRNVVVNRVGTAARNTIAGTAGPDGILGLGGNDVLNGLGANDALCGGPGRDKLRGGPGKDSLLGQGGADRLLGQGARDLLIGGAGPDRLLGGPGRDQLRGGPGRDRQRQ
jgi:CSLREA domain-containing protein